MSHSTKSHTSLTLQNLKRDSERYRLAASIANIGIWEYELESGKHYWSPEFRTLLGIDTDVQPCPDIILNNVDADDRELFDDLIDLHASPAQTPHETRTLRYTRPGDTQPRWLSITVSKVADHLGNHVRVMAVVRDMTAEQSINERLEYIATHDFLTNLPNREYFCHRLDETIASAEVQGLRPGLLILDVDHLKSVNDTYGHDIGDKLLRAFAQRLKTILREHDLVGRLGGDEFAFLVKDASKKDALEQLAHRILSEMVMPFQIEAMSIECRPSIGGCRLNSQCKTAEEVMKGADLALYAAKLRRRGSFVMFQREMMTEVKARRRATTDLQASLSKNEIYAFYQPKVDLVNRRIIGLEALMRWRKKDSKDFLSPATIEMALDDPGMSAAVFDRMLDLVASDVSGWCYEGLPFGNVSINIAEGELRDSQFINRFVGKLTGRSIPLEKIQLEIIESAVFTRASDRIQCSLEFLQSLGIKIALDDFGTGYAALSHLQQYPIDILKIDKSFILGMISKSGNKAIIKAILDIGKNFELDVIAEGVETEEQANYLTTAGCQFAQGHLFSRPVPASQIPRLLTSSCRQAP